MLHFALTGAHGTGKSTLIQHLVPALRLMGRVNICREAPRLLIDAVRDPEFFRRDNNTVQRPLLITIEHLLEERRAISDCNFVISDRTLVDHLAYTRVLFPEIIDTVELAICRRHAFESLSSYCFVFKLPIEFAPKDDGVRESDLVFQKEIDAEIDTLYQEAGFTPLAIYGSVEERATQVLASLSQA